MNRATWARNSAQQLINNPAFWANWSPVVLEIWLRDDCRCVYCGRSMLESRDIAYYFSCKEHVLPVHKYEHLKDAIWNQVLACRPCNQLKLRFDPANDGTPADEAHLNIFIERAKAHIEGLRAGLEERFVQEAKLLRDALDGFDESALAASRG